MKILVVLLTVLAIDLAKAQWYQGDTGSSSQCGMINGQYQSTSCSYSPGRGMICNNSGGSPSGGNNQGYFPGNIQGPSGYFQDNFQGQPGQFQGNFQGQLGQIQGNFQGQSSRSHCDDRTGTRRCTVERCKMAKGLAQRQRTKCTKCKYIRVNF